ncbi:MAG: alkaline phosphatase family protein [Eubacterium sp.]|nr:alkaline phosphatase family protein [Eubacterium sp.]
MKKSAKALLAFICIIALVAWAVLYALFGFIPSKYFTESDKNVAAIEVEDELNNLDIMANTWETALPQTEIYRLITDHFNSPLPEGKTEKKAIVIGYDGCRADTFRLIDPKKSSGIYTLLNEGGQAVFSYAGGVNYPAENTQATSTAPGWCSMLTGVLADVHKITDNGIVKEIEPKTLLLSLVEDKTVDSSAFYVSWDGHFSKKDATYIKEKEYAEENKFPVNFKRALFDTGTKKNVLNDIKSSDCSDFIFLTLEYTDHNGHNSGFSLQNPNSVNGFRKADDAGAQFINAIKARENYDKEDWLILITTDHGGYGGGHGGPTIDERITFIVSNKTII